MLTPPDYEKTRDYWEGLGVGACGPSVIATATGKTVQEIIDAWDEKYMGTANVGHIERELRKYGFATKRVAGKKSKTISMPPGCLQALAFIQWGEHKHWIEAQKHTHWIYLEIWNDDLHVFCNGEGWFRANSERGREYLKDGHIRSIIALSTPA